MNLQKKALKKAKEEFAQKNAKAGTKAPAGKMEQPFTPRRSLEAVLEGERDRSAPLVGRSPLELAGADKIFTSSGKGRLASTEVVDIRSYKKPEPNLDNLNKEQAPSAPASLPDPDLDEFEKFLNGGDGEVITEGEEEPKPIEKTDEDNGKDLEGFFDNLFSKRVSKQGSRVVSSQVAPKAPVAKPKAKPTTTKPKKKKRKLDIDIVTGIKPED